MQLDQSEWVSAVRAMLIAVQQSVKQSPPARTDRRSGFCITSLPNNLTRIQVGSIPTPHYGAEMKRHPSMRHEELKRRIANLRRSATRMTLKDDRDTLLWKAQQLEQELRNRFPDGDSRDTSDEKGKSDVAAPDL